MYYGWYSMEYVKEGFCTYSYRTKEGKVTICTGVSENKESTFYSENWKDTKYLGEVGDYIKTNHGKLCFCFRKKY